MPVSFDQALLLVPATLAAMAAMAAMVGVLSALWARRPLPARRSGRVTRREALVGSPGMEVVRRRTTRPGGRELAALVLNGHALGRLVFLAIGITLVAGVASGFSRLLSSGELRNQPTAPQSKSFFEFDSPSPDHTAKDPYARPR